MKQNQSTGDDSLTAVAHFITVLDTESDGST